METQFVSPKKFYKFIIFGFLARGLPAPTSFFLEHCSLACGLLQLPAQLKIQAATHAAS